jgi:two-component system C4-dicarboxylate transport sensor histidine kinase DctB
VNDQTSPPLVGDRQRETSKPTRLGFLLFLFVAFAICTNPVAYVTGLPLSFAPFFYVLAARRWGFYQGLIAAIILTLPTVLWWDMGWFVGAAVCKYLFTQLCRRRGLLAAEAFAIFQLLIAPLFIVLCLWRFQASFSMLMLYALQYSLGEILLAAMADIASLNFTLMRPPPYISIKPSRSIDLIFRAMINFLIAFVLTLSVANQAMITANVARNERARMRAPVTAQVTAQVHAGHSSGRVQWENAKVYYDVSAADFTARAQRALGPECAWPLPLESDNAAGRYGTWIGRCETSVYEAADTKPILIAIVYGDVDEQHPVIGGHLLLLLVGGALALGYRLSLSRSLLSTIATCNDFIDRFGTLNLPMPPPLPIREVDRPLRAFVERNNIYAAAIDDRDRLMKAVVDLKRSVDLVLMGQIRFDERSGILSFNELRITMPPRPRQLQVHASDAASFLAMKDSDEAAIEFRTADGEDFQSRIITLHQHSSTMCWESGIMVKLSQPRRLRELMVQQARLVDLGGMASAISHEIKQPLFTIAVAAESMQLMLGKGRTPLADEQMAMRIARISEQVDRARQIIERISHYGRSDITQSTEVHVADVVRDAVSFLVAMLDDRRITVSVDIAAETDSILISRIALEQVIVNAIQNAADSVVARREAGWSGEGQIIVEVSAAGQKTRCAIKDNGIGLPPGMAESAFNAFFTTKTSHNGSGLGLFISRQIIVEAGGSIRLRPGKQHGAILEIDLPWHLPKI